VAGERAEAAGSLSPAAKTAITTHVLDRDGRLIVKVPETVEASADELAPALQVA